MRVKRRTAIGMCMIISVMLTSAFSFATEKDVETIAISELENNVQEECIVEMDNGNEVNLVINPRIINVIDTDAIKSKYNTRLFYVQFYAKKVNTTQHVTYTSGATKDFKSVYSEPSHTIDYSVDKNV